MRRRAWSTPRAPPASMPRRHSTQWRAARPSGRRTAVGIRSEGRFDVPVGVPRGRSFAAPTGTNVAKPYARPIGSDTHGFALTPQVR